MNISIHFILVSIIIFTLKYNNYSIIVWTNGTYFADKTPELGFLMALLSTIGLVGLEIGCRTEISGWREATPSLRLETSFCFWLVRLHDD